MREIVECIPNFSTSDSKVVELVLDAVKKTSNSFLLDHTFDDSYNRLVVSFIGDKESVVKAALASAVVAVNNIDMRTHKGQHPRIGAVDIVPYIPIKNVSIQDCVELAREFGEKFAAKTGVPVYLYGEAAYEPLRKDLDWIREGEYEKLSEMILKAERKPDFGPAAFNAQSGATVTGARKVMAGFNVNIGTDDLKIGKKVAKALHAKKGGFTYVKAMAASVPEKGLVQIGMSVNDFDKTPLYRVFEVLKVECARYNVPIVGSEFCGLAPLKSLMDVASYYLKIDNLTEDRVLEMAIQNAIEKGGKPQ